MTLKRIGGRYALKVMVAPEVIAGGERVSSSRIRRLLQQGEVEEGARLLDRGYFIDGTVVKGDARGRKLGFPTANVLPLQEVIVPYGVYAGGIQIRERIYPAAIHFGPLPTVNKQAKSLEVHALGYSGDCYGETVRIWFLRRVREVKRFPDESALSRQILKDIEIVKNAFSEALCIPLRKQGKGDLETLDVTAL